MNKWLYFLGGVVAGAAGLGAVAYIADACSGKSGNRVAVVVVPQTGSAEAPGLDTAGADAASGEPAYTASADMSAAAPEAETANDEPAADADIPGASMATA